MSARVRAFVALSVAAAVGTSATVLACTLLRRWRRGVREGAHDHHEDRRDCVQTGVHTVYDNCTCHGTTTPAAAAATAASSGRVADEERKEKIQALETSDGPMYFDYNATTPVHGR